MRSPFPGMDPCLEHPALWPDVHNRLITATSDALTPLIAPKYFIALGRRAYRLAPGDLEFIGRPDTAVVPRAEGVRETTPAFAATGAPTVLDVEVPLPDEVGDLYLQVRVAGTRELVTVMEILSPANKLLGRGRRAYEQKRLEVFESLTSLVEVDLMRDGEPMPVGGRSVQSDYRILVSCGNERPRAKLFAFNLPDPIPVFPLPLRPEDEEPDVDLNAILHDVYDRARFDLQVDYDRPPVPSLTAEQSKWAATLIAQQTR